VILDQVVVLSVIAVTCHAVAFAQELVPAHIHSQNLIFCCCNRGSPFRAAKGELPRTLAVGRGMTRIWRAPYVEEPEAEIVRLGQATTTG